MERQEVPAMCFCGHELHHGFCQLCLCSHLYKVTEVPGGGVGWGGSVSFCDTPTASSIHIGDPDFTAERKELWWLLERGGGFWDWGECGLKRSLGTSALSELSEWSKEWSVCKTPPMWEGSLALWPAAGEMPGLRVSPWREQGHPPLCAPTPHIPTVVSLYPSLISATDSAFVVMVIVVIESWQKPTWWIKRCCSLSSSCFNEDILFWKILKAFFTLSKKMTIGW